ncbi:hypothetical protein GCM10027341_10650 [Spirosoma knui]
MARNLPQSSQVRSLTGERATIYSHDQRVVTIFQIKLTKYTIEQNNVGLT